MKMKLTSHPENSGSTKGVISPPVLLALRCFATLVHLEGTQITNNNLTILSPVKNELGNAV